MDPFGGILQIGGQFLSAERGAFLNAYTVCAEKRQVHSNHKLLGGVAFRNQIKAVPTGVLQLVKSQIAKFHLYSFRFPNRTW